MFVRILRIAAPVALACALLGSAAPARADSGIVALTPHPSERVAHAPVTISAQVLGAHGTLDKTKIHVVVDGRDVSDAIAVSGTRVDFTPSPALSNGEHAVEIAVTDASGGKLSYTWTFTVDGPVPQAAQPADAVDASGTQPGAAGAVDAAAPSADAMQQSAPILGLQGDGTQSFGSFYPLAPGPVYWGQQMNFYFTGVPNGWGFLTFGGIPGVFDLIPLGYGTFFTTVPIPVGYLFGAPPVACHFFGPGGVPYVFPYQTPIHIVAHRSPLLTTPTVGRITTVRTPPTHLMTSHGAVHASPMHAMPHTGIHAMRAAPSFARPTFAVARPAMMRPIFHQSSAPMFHASAAAFHPSLSSGRIR